MWSCVSEINENPKKYLMTLYINKSLTIIPHNCKAFLLYRNENKPPAMPVCPQLALASSKKPPML